jgi:hypothetical protein
MSCLGHRQTLLGKTFQWYDLPCTNAFSHFLRFVAGRSAMARLISATLTKFVLRKNHAKHDASVPLRFRSSYFPYPSFVSISALQQESMVYSSDSSSALAPAQRYQHQQPGAPRCLLAPRRPQWCSTCFLAAGLESQIYAFGSWWASVVEAHCFENPDLPW